MNPLSYLAYDMWAPNPQPARAPRFEADSREGLEKIRNPVEGRLEAEPAAHK